MSEKTKITIIIAISATIITIVGMLLLWNVERTKVFVENGYTRSTLPGEDLVQWIKTKEE